MTDYSIKSINDLHEGAGPLLYVANKHFPDECYERYLLLKTSDMFNQLAAFTYHLARARTVIEGIRSLGLPDKSSIMYYSLYMANISAAMAKQAVTKDDKEAAEAVKRMAEFLDTWYSLYLTLECLMDITADFHFLTNRPKGNG